MERKELTRTLQYEGFLNMEQWKSAQKLTESADSQEDPSLDEAKLRITKAMTMIAGRYPFFGEFIYNFRILYVKPNDKHIKTMATDGVNIFVNPAFALKLTLKEVIFVLCHEILHNVMVHFSRRVAAGINNPKRWNVAADLEINPMLVDEGLLTKEELKNGLKGLYEDEYLGVPAEEIYRRLKKDNFNPLPPGIPGDDSDDDSDDDNDNDSDSQDGKGKKKKGNKNNKDDKSNSDQGDDGEDSDEDIEAGGDGEGNTEDGDEKEDKSSNGGSKTGSDSSRKTAESGYDNQGIGGTITADISRKIQKELGVDVQTSSAEKVKEIIEKVRDVSSRIDTKGEKRLLANGIANLTRPLVDWKAELKRFVGRQVSEERHVLGKRKHIQRGVYIYDRKKGTPSNLGKAVIAIDTSGSMGEGRLKHVLGEVYGIVTAKKIKKTEVIYFDHSVYKQEIVGNPPKFSFRPAPGGGTDYDKPLAVMYDLFKGGQMEVGIFITDGDPYALDKELLDTYKKMANKFVWLVLNNPSYEHPFGSIIYATIKED